MLLIYRENNPQRDMTFQDMARAVSRLDQTGIRLRNTSQGRCRFPCRWIWQ
jgi:hypothetical protein